MTISEIVDGLQRSLRDEVVVDRELRERILAQYDDTTSDGIPPEAVIRVRWERPRWARSLRKALDRLDRIAQERWGAPLPPAFRQVYEAYGRLVMTIRWEEDGEEEIAGCAWDWPAVSLSSSWVTEPAWEQADPHGSRSVTYWPVIPFMNAESSDPVCLVFRHEGRVEVPSVEWIIPDSFRRTEAGPLFQQARPGGFTEWLARWIETGLSPNGGVDP